MGMKPRTPRPRLPRLRVTFTEEEVREIYEQLCRSYVGHGATMRLLKKLSGWLDTRPKKDPNQLELPGTEDAG